MSAVKLSIAHTCFFMLFYCCCSPTRPSHFFAVRGYRRLAIRRAPGARVRMLLFLLAGAAMGTIDVRSAPLL